MNVTEVVDADYVINSSSISGRNAGDAFERGMMELVLPWWVQTSLWVALLSCPVALLADVCGFLIGYHLPRDSPTPTIIQYMSVTDALFITEMGSVCAACLQLTKVWRLTSVYWCKGLTFINWVSLCAMQFTYAALSLDRVLALYIPLRYRLWTRKSVWYPLLSITLLSVLSGVWPFITYDIYLFDNTWLLCRASPENQLLVAVLTCVVYIVAPVTLVLFFNALIVVALVRRHKDPNKHSSANEAQLSVYLGSMTGFFAVSVVTANILFMVFYYQHVYLMSAVFTEFYCLNSVINLVFFLHNPLMRKTFTSLLKRPISAQQTQTN